ncbi:hypothetical protein BT96DRAFT_1012842 [Gymnopus androsaceus JB14]|uniref:Uncharacterized protein n=1 Tax=Gymnopus androsaceus JB14 TaxID=1447944 RepID=A0A6A4IHU4_9AGAR|nr:hypothetical protein BT96DRAFT_1012842 [Gymnopus androsaceus JB14]
MMLPEELLQAVVEHLAKPQFIERGLDRIRWKYARNGLISLSMANHQWRRICIPFLFAYVRVSMIRDEIKKLIADCTTNNGFATSIRTLVLEYFSLSSINMIYSLLPHLINLSQFHLEGNKIDLALLTAINSHPTLTTVLLNASYGRGFLELPSQSAPLDLSKVVLKGALFDLNTSIQSLNSYLSRGMEVTRVLFGTLSPKPLYNDSPSVLPWLVDFVQIHPSLKKITFFNHHATKLLTASTVPFMSQFLVKINSDGLSDTIRLTMYAITRSGPSSQPSARDPFRDWHVSGIFLCFSQWSAGRVLHAAHSLLPDVSVLTIRSENVQIDAKELFISLCRFSSLRVVSLEELGKSWEVDFSKSTTVADLGASIIVHASRMMKQIPTVEAFFIQQDSFNGWTLNDGQSTAGHSSNLKLCV